MPILSKEELIKFIEINKSNFTKQLRFYHKDLYDQINAQYQHTKFAQKLYHYIHGDNIGKCPVCNLYSIFDGINKGYRKYCSYKCSGAGKKETAREIRTCKICSIEFKTYKKAKNQFCSNDCRLIQNKLNASLRSERAVASSIRNHNGIHHMKLLSHKIKAKETCKLRYNNENFKNITKAKKTKLERYGNENYNNIDKNKATCLSKYGVKNIFLYKKANGIGISKPQRRLYEMIKEKYTNAVLEYHIPELNISADIYIPEKNLIVEFFGDYWHCNPKKYQPTYWHKAIHLTAADIWTRDMNRTTQLKKLGFDVKVIWESDFTDSLPVI
jgi:G:T-mismatch repair DNA endonuclease (very short patch repair protein)